MKIGKFFKRAFGGIFKDTKRLLVEQLLGDMADVIIYEAMPIVYKEQDPHKQAELVKELLKRHCDKQVKDLPERLQNLLAYVIIAKVLERIKL
ncbi:MAG: hypothetical protein QXV23_05210 [Candidatus Bathyarchaeia archaeon]